jgi:endogenous inhibitor of DNA gyrase (YacG/DUF329 family)
MTETADQFGERDEPSGGVHCPACGAVVDAHVVERGGVRDDAPLTCPTCGAGFTRDGSQVHPPAIGP